MIIHTRQHAYHICFVYLQPLTCESTAWLIFPAQLEHAANSDAMAPPNECPTGMSPPVHVSPVSKGITCVAQRGSSTNRFTSPAQEKGETLPIHDE